MPGKKGRFLSGLFLLSLSTLSGSQVVRAQDDGAAILKPLKFRHIGPPGNRISAVAGVPGDPYTYYAGAASGGIFKTTDGGAQWTPIFDDQAVLIIGSLAVAPSNPKIVWAGTGETFFRNDNKYLPIGNGIYKSADAGKTWRHAGLEKTGRIGRIVVDPRNPDIVFAAAMGHCNGPQPERGVFRTTDGGKTWKHVLFVDENTGCSDIALDPANPRILYAGMWQALREHSGGPGSGLYVSRDRGNTWKKLSGRGLPAPPLGKIGVAVAPSRPRRVYALIETGNGVPWRGKETSPGVLWRSDDQGENWELVSYDLSLAGRFAYYTRCVVAPDNPDEVFFLAAQFLVSGDGGKTTKSIGQVLHADHHDMWIDPTNGNRMIQSNDGGIGLSVNRGKTWQQINLPTAQLYHVSVDNQIPYYVYGNQQDWPSQRGPSNSRLGRTGIPRGLWHDVGGSESGFALADPADNNIIWSTGHPGGAIDRYDVRTGHARDVSVWPDEVWGWADEELKYRFQRTFPIAISPFDSKKVFIGSQYVHQTTDGGKSWKTISPDLTTNDKSKQKGQDSLTPMNSGTEDCVVFALAASRLEEGVLWAGTNDGLVQVTRDGGGHWTNVTANIPGLPPGGTISNIESSRHQRGTCYLTVTLHEQNNQEPYVFKTTDYGKNWTSLAADVPQSILSYARCIREDPVRPGLLYLGTENALYVSFNDGTNWELFLNNIPHVPVHWMAIQEHFNDLAIATYGRGFWILDDITPLQQFTPKVAEAPVHLFTPRPAYRFREIKAPMVQAGDPCVGENPLYGASLNYYLKQAETAPVRISILDAKGQVVRTLEGSKERGLNRVWWDLRSDLSSEPRLMTSPLYAPWVKIGDQGWRPVPLRGGGRFAVLASPGQYTVTLSVGEKTYSQKLTVQKDPHSAGTEQDIQVQAKLLGEIRAEVNAVVDMINQLESLRKQTMDIQARLAAEKSLEPILAATKAFAGKLISAEAPLVQLAATGRGQDNTYLKTQFLSRLLAFAAIVGKTDFPPSPQQLERHREFKIEAESYRKPYLELLKNDLPAFNRLLRENNIPGLTTGNKP